MWHRLIRAWNASPLGQIHARRLPPRLAAHVPQGARVLDVGCGDGTIAARVAALAGAAGIEGVDTVLQPRPAVPVTAFDGHVLPFGEDSFDLVMLVDVLHHSRQPQALLAEAVRVSRGPVLIKDHDWTNPAERALLTLADYLGNRPYGVDLPYGFLRPQDWTALFAALGLRPHVTQRFTYGGGDLCRQVIFVVGRL